MACHRWRHAHTDKIPADTFTYMHIRTALGHKNTCRLTDDHGISSISARTLEVGVYPSLTRISYMSPWPRLMAPYFKFKLRVWPAECTFSHSVYCLPAVAGRDRQQWQAARALAAGRDSGRAIGRPRRGRRPMRQPRSGQTGQRLRICLISIRSAGRSLRPAARSGRCKVGRA